MLERWHRCLKASLMCHANENWVRSLSTVMLGLITNVLDTGASPAEYLYGTTLRILGQFILPKDFSEERNSFLLEFREHMRTVKPVPVEHRNNRKVFMYKDIGTCSHVFLKAPPVRKSLDCPYSGPHRVIERKS